MGVRGTVYSELTLTDAAATRLTVVGIGASAGGIEAFRGFFENMPADSGMAFVVVLHLPIDRKSILPDIIGRWTAMRTIEVTDGCAVEPDCVYLPPSGIGVVFRDRRLFLCQAAAELPREHSPISLFFNSLALGLNEDAIGIVLSGTGSDGALGLKAIRTRGGLTLAQATDSHGPQHGGMPASAIATGAVDIVAQVEAMPGHIMAVRRMHQAHAAGSDLAAEPRSMRLAICRILLQELGHDFSGYKERTFLRRVQRRMHVLRLPTLGDYVARLAGDRAEAVTLFHDLLIGVTSFFRDSGTFDALRRLVLPRLFEGKGPEDSLRVWVAGCSTGEEAYSLAMLLQEYADTVSRPPRIQIFATDIDDPAIATARAGHYPSSLLEGLAPERLARFFIAGPDGTYRLSKQIRDVCTFSVHSLTRDPPFSRLDLVSCRNLLIYLAADLQADVVPGFHYSLVPHGFLLLGSSETVARYDQLFSPIDRSHRIFQRLEGPGQPLRAGQPGRLAGALMTAGSLPQGTPARVPSRVSQRATARVLERFAPAFVVVTSDGIIVQYSARTGRFLEPGSGAPTQSLLDMARRGLRAPLRALLRHAAETRRVVEKTRVAVDIPGEGTHRITLSVEPVFEQGSDTLFLVVFVEASHLQSDAPAERRPDPAVTPPDNDLESELRDTREELQAITEEHDTALEELRSANEELHSVNEELQSTNEELETSKEEIQSINEELQTVNAQLAAKVDEQDRRNIDLQNLFEGTQVATIFLDPHLLIRGFTPAVASIYNLIPSDHGRPLTDIVGRLRYGRLREDVRRVLETLEPLERRVVRDDDSAHYLMRVLPYRTPDSKVDGTIVTFVDVSSIVHAEQHQRLLVDELNHRVKNMLTVVISLATQTMRRSGSIEEFSKNYMGRIHALTAAYSLLSNEAWQTVQLRDIVMEELKPFLTHDRTNVSLLGPPVPLEPRSALALGMAIHELTTNAVKYGALSVSGGHVAVRWQVERGSNGDQLSLDWTEQGGPLVVPPSRRGFGMTLIERGLRQDMSAEVDVEFAVDGVKARLRAPMQVGSAAMLYPPDG